MADHNRDETQFPSRRDYENACAALRRERAKRVEAQDECQTLEEINSHQERVLDRMRVRAEAAEEMLRLALDLDYDEALLESRIREHLANAEENTS